MLCWGNPLFKKLDPEISRISILSKDRTLDIDIAGILFFLMFWNGA